MANELQVQLSMNFSKLGAVIQRQLNAQFNVAANVGLLNIQNVGLVDETLDLGDVATPGFLLYHNLAAYMLLTTPAAPVITNAGTPGAATWTYKVVARQPDGAYTAASSAGSTATGNATLTGSNYNTIAWAAPTGAVLGSTIYDIYRTAHGSSPSTNGLIGSTTNLTFDDTGLAGDSATAPSTAIDNLVLIGSNGTSYPASAKGQEFGLFRFNGSAIHAKSNTAALNLEYILIPD